MKKLKRAFTPTELKMHRNAEGGRVVIHFWGQDVLGDGNKTGALMFENGGWRYKVWEESWVEKKTEAAEVGLGIPLL